MDIPAGNILRARSAVEDLDDDISRAERCRKSCRNDRNMRKKLLVKYMVNDSNFSLEKNG